MAIDDGAIVVAVVSLGSDVVTVVVSGDVVL